MMQYEKRDENRSLWLFLADDDSDDRELFSDALESTSFTAQTALFGNGGDLLEELSRCSEKLPDAVFLDLHMPLVKGEESLAKIRAVRKFDMVKVVIYSGTEDQAKRNELFKLGADIYLEKPYSFQNLKDSLAICLDAIKSGRQEQLIITASGY